MFFCKTPNSATVSVHGRVSVSWVVVSPFPQGRHSAVLPSPHLVLLSPRGQISGAIDHRVCTILLIKKMRRLPWRSLLKVKKQTGFASKMGEGMFLDGGEEYSNVFIK